MSFHETLRATKVRHLNLPSPSTVDASATVEDAVRHMRTIRCACSLVVEDGKVIGIVTERDVLNKLVGRPALLSRSVREFMTPDPVTLSPEDTLDEAIRRMSEGGYRNLPVLDEHGKPIASLSAPMIIKFIVEHFPQDVYNLPPRPEQEIPTPEGA